MIDETDSMMLSFFSDKSFVEPILWEFVKDMFLCGNFVGNFRLWELTQFQNVKIFHKKSNVLGWDLVY